MPGFKLDLAEEHFRDAESFYWLRGRDENGKARVAYICKRVKLYRVEPYKPEPKQRNP
jgi:hypothetical protein